MFSWLTLVFILEKLSIGNVYYINVNVYSGGRPWITKSYWGSKPWHYRRYLKPSRRSSYYHIIVLINFGLNLTKMPLTPYLRIIGWTVWTVLRWTLLYIFDIIVWKIMFYTFDHVHISKLSISYLNIFRWFIKM